MNPTDPMTPVRALIEAAGKATPGPWDVPDTGTSTGRVTISKGTPWQHDGMIGETDAGNYARSAPEGLANAQFIASARNATASISQLLSEHDKVVEYIKELRDEGVCMPSNTYKTLPDERHGLLRCADRLAAILEGK